MKTKSIVMALLVAACVGYSAAAYAASQFYIEIGHDMSEADATGAWRDLAKAHPKLLGNLTFYPKSVLLSGNDVSTRIQAGPITTKARADKICNSLFKKDVACFVIEGVEDAPSSRIVSFSGERGNGSGQQMVILPWLAEKRVEAAAVEAAPAQAEEPPVLPWLRDKRTGEVNVAEAVRVPLTEGEIGQPIVVRYAPADASSPQDIAQSGGGIAIPDGTRGWLRVESFLSDAVALEFWDRVRDEAPGHAARLRMRSVTPVLAEENRTTLLIGPFDGRDNAFSFCRREIQSKDTALRCMFSTEAQSPTIQEVRNDTTRKRFAGNLPDTARLKPSAAAPKPYWVELLSAASESDALDQWETLKTAHTDILAGLRSSISPSKREMGAHVVRVGPLATEQDSIQLCQALQEREVNCRVLRRSRP